MLRVGDEVAARSEAGVKAAACSEAGDELAACYGAGVEDSRRWCSGVQGDKRVSAWRFQKFAKCCETACWSLIPWIPRAVGYGPITWTRPNSPSSQTTKVRYLALGTAPPLLTRKHRGHLSIKDHQDDGPRDPRSC
jgi:hypothetical protein